MPTGGNTHLAVNDAQRAEERIQAYELKLLGWSNRRIAAEMGCSHTKVAYLIDEEADSRVLPLVDRYRKHALDQLDLAIGKVMEQLGQNKAVARNAEVLAKLIERKSRFIGADAPVQQEITATVEQRPTELMDLVAKARVLVAEQTARNEAA